MTFFEKVSRVLAPGSVGAALVLALVPAFAPAVAHEPESPRTIPPPRAEQQRVLFIGNSYTYYNNLPEILRDLAEEAGFAREVYTVMLVEGGRTLAEAWDDHDVRETIR